MKPKRFLQLLPALMLWLMVSAFFWSWIFTFLTDTTADKKVAVYIDAAVPDSTALAVKLEEVKSPALKMVVVHPFSYAMFDGDALKNADIFLVAESNVETYKDWFQPMPESLIPATADCLIMDGTAYGLPADNAAATYIGYQEGERYYLLFGSASVHTGALDSEALPIAERLLSLP